MLLKTILYSQKFSNKVTYKVLRTSARPTSMSTIQTLDRLDIFDSRKRSRMKQKYEILPPHQIDWQVSLLRVLERKGG